LDELNDPISVTGVRARLADHADKIVRRLEREIFPWIGKRPIAKVLSSKEKGITTSIWIDKLDALAESMMTSGAFPIGS
jgi:hypothetical protein